DVAGVFLLSHPYSFRDIPQIVNTLLDELDWQFIDLEREICRRREIIRVVLNEGENHHLDSWTKELLAYLATR
ncbi:MAG: hypothetical protein Q7J20_08200, partial [Candidatus Nitrotoga sp.]|nr:hypothetical protein [Candidatus Nitrotoga sp.]